MRVRGVDTVFFKVTDLDRAVAWYRDVLGIEPGPRLGDWQVLDVGGDVTLALHLFDRAGADVNAVVVLAVDDLNAAIDQAVAHGAQPIDPDVTNTGDRLFTTFADPDRNHVQLIERPDG